MDFINYFYSVGPALLFKSPIIVAWIVGIVIAVRMLKRGGGKAERLLWIGCCIMLAETIISPFTQVLMAWLIDQRQIREITAQDFGFTMSMARIPLSILSLAGIVCLVYAFWIKFKAGLKPTPVPTP